MFTGLIEEIGFVDKMTQDTKSSVITIRATKVIKDLAIGDSISTNGVCLTVTSFNQATFTVDVMPETMRMSSFGELRPGHQVNLERALRLGDRFGGHMVSGHIDGKGIIKSITIEENATWVNVAINNDQRKYMLNKGSVAIDGMSLTISAVNKDSISLSIIPHTKEVTTLLKKKVGESVNIECDLIGKYVEQLLNITKKEEVSESISLSFLKNNGFA